MKDRVRAGNENESHHQLRRLACLFLVATGCTEFATEPTGGDAARLTVDASQAWVFVDLDETARVVSVAEAATSEDWDIAFFATSVMLNGGGAGPGGVTGYCICTHAEATSGEIMAMTAESELPAFESVGMGSVPAETMWQADSLVTAISDWYRYDPVAHVVTPAPDRVWKVRTSDGAAYAKLHVTGIEGAAEEHAGRVTLEYALQRSPASAFEPVRQITVDVSDGPVAIDLQTGAASNGSDWDVRIESWFVRVNGGASGGGQAGAVRVDEPFDGIMDASDLPADHYRGDAFGGVFARSPWYRYNLDGQHQIWPTYDVYLVRREEQLYKVQIIGYYGGAGESRQITFRYSPLDG